MRSGCWRGLNNTTNDVLQLGAMSVEPTDAFQLDRVAGAGAFNACEQLHAAPNKIHGDRPGGPGGQWAHAVVAADECAYAGEVETLLRLGGAPGYPESEADVSFGRSQLGKREVDHAGRCRRLARHQHVGGGAIGVQDAPVDRGLVKIREVTLELAGQRTWGCWPAILEQ